MTTIDVEAFIAAVRDVMSGDAEVIYTSPDVHHRLHQQLLSSINFDVATDRSDIRILGCDVIPHKRLDGVTIVCSYGDFLPVAGDYQ